MFFNIKIENLISIFQFKGAPYPEQEENAIDCVMRFAINKLGFTENKIIVYGWSIGGYTATWAAMNYPGISNLVSDSKPLDKILDFSQSYLF